MASVTIDAERNIELTYAALRYLLETPVSQRGEDWQREAHRMLHNAASAVLQMDSEMYER